MEPEVGKFAIWNSAYTGVWGEYGQVLEIKPKTISVKDQWGTLPRRKRKDEILAYVATEDEAKARIAACNAATKANQSAVNDARKALNSATDAQRQAALSALLGSEAS